MMGPEPIIFIQAVLTINFKCLPFYIFIKIVPVFQVSRRREKVEESGIKKIKQNFGVQPLVGLEYLQGSINILFATLALIRGRYCSSFLIPIVSFLIECGINLLYQSRCYSLSSLQGAVFLDRTFFFSSFYKCSIYFLLTKI